MDTNKEISELINKKRYFIAIWKIKRQLKLVEEKEKHFLYLQIGLIYHLLSENYPMLSNYFDTKYISSLRKSINTIDTNPNPYVQLGLFYFKTNQYDLALEYLDTGTMLLYKHIELYLEKDIDLLEIDFYKNQLLYYLSNTGALSQIHYQSGKFRESSGICLIALVLFKKHPNLILPEFKEQLALLVSNIATNYSLLNDFSSSKKFFDSDLFSFYSELLKDTYQIKQCQILKKELIEFPEQVFKYQNSKVLQNWISDLYGKINNADSKKDYSLIYRRILQHVLTTDLQKEIYNSFIDVKTKLLADKKKTDKDFKDFKEIETSVKSNLGEIKKLNTEKELVKDYVKFAEGALKNMSLFHTTLKELQKFNLDYINQEFTQIEKLSIKHRLIYHWIIIKRYILRIFFGVFILGTLISAIISSFTDVRFIISFIISLLGFIISEWKIEPKIQEKTLNTLKVLFTKVFNDITMQVYVKYNMFNDMRNTILKENK